MDCFFFLIIILGSLNHLLRIVQLFFFACIDLEFSRLCLWLFFFHVYISALLAKCACFIASRVFHPLFFLFSAFFLFHLSIPNLLLHFQFFSFIIHHLSKTLTFWYCLVLFTFTFTLFGLGELFSFFFYFFFLFLFHVFPSIYLTFFSFLGVRYLLSVSLLH